MEYKIEYKEFDVCEEIIGSFMDTLVEISDIDMYEMYQNSGDGLLGEPAFYLYIKYKVKRDIANSIISGDLYLITTIMEYLNDILQDEQFTYNLFVYYFENHFEQFILYLNSEFEDDLNESCHDLLSSEWDSFFLDEENAEDKMNNFCNQFKTIEDYIRLFPTIYNILYDAFNTVASIHTRKKIELVNPNVPDEILNLINNYHLKYDKSKYDLVEEWWKY